MQRIGLGGQVCKLKHKECTVWACTKGVRTVGGQESFDYITQVKVGKMSKRKTEVMILRRYYKETSMLSTNNKILEGNLGLRLGLYIADFWVPL